jgi:amidase
LRIDAERDVRPASEGHRHHTDLRGWRIAYSIDLGYVEVEPEVASNTLATLDLFREFGATVEEVRLGWTDRIDRVAANYFDHMIGAYISGVAKERRDLLTDYAADTMDRGMRSRAEDLLEALTVCGEMYDTFGPMMERYDVFICPTATTTRVKADFNHLHDQVFINGKEIEPEMGIAMAHQFNMLSRCPVLAMPSGMASNGVPTGIQIVGRTFDDERVFRAGAALEKARPWFSNASNRPAP